MPYVTKTEQENIKKMLSLDIKDKWQLKNIADPNGKMCIRDRYNMVLQKKVYKQLK